MGPISGFGHLVFSAATEMSSNNDRLYLKFEHVYQEKGTSELLVSCSGNGPSMKTAVPYSFANERYVVQRTLGIGSMGVVYEVLDRERNMRVALKTLINMGSDNLYYFKKEFRALQDLGCLFGNPALWI